MTDKTERRLFLVLKLGTTIMAAVYVIYFLMRVYYARHACDVCEF